MNAEEDVIPFSIDDVEGLSGQQGTEGASHSES